MAEIRDVMSTELVAVSPRATIAEAATVMGTGHVGAALVMDGDSLVGIFTERDILRALASDFDAAGHVVSHWMTERPTTLHPRADTGEALGLMLSGGFRHVPVVDGEQVVGIVSMRDVAPLG
jgi:CBS domain-containing protein